MLFIWNWLRNPKNLAVLTAIGSVVGYLISLAAKSEDPTSSPVPQPAIVVSPQIHIENNPSNVVRIEPRTQSGDVQASTQEAPQPHARTSSPAVRFPVRRNAGAGISVEIIPGFSVTIVGIFGVDDRLRVDLMSELWEGNKREFPVGAHPIDITVKGRTYQLSVESADTHSALIVLDRARP